MGFFILVIWVLLVSACCAALYTFDSWFENESFWEKALLYFTCVLIFPIVVLGICFHQLFLSLKGE